MDSRGATSRSGDLGLALILAALGFSSVEVIRTLHAHQRVRQDLAELQDVAHGLLDPNVWIEQATAILETKIEQFQFTPERRREIKPILERTLDAAITKADQYLSAQRNANVLRVRLQEDVREKLMSAQDVKDGIPGYADAILDEMAKPEARRQLQRVLRSGLSSVAQQTFSPPKEGRLPAIRHAYGCDDRSSCEERLRVRLAAIHAHALEWTGCVLTLALLLFAGVAWSTRGAVSQTRLAMLIGGCALLLACGIFSPMLDVEARISRLSFVLLGEPIEFTDQVLYFQSKSVLEVVQVLTATGKPDMILVGLLLVTFSVFFPLAKLTSSLLYLYDVAGLRQRALVTFFALKSSKWSMADVFVVAMFMAYIGFNGVVNSELQAFAQAAAPEVTVLTTNGSSLQLGYFLFLAFCLAGLVTSSIFHASLAEQEDHPHAAPHERLPAHQKPSHA